MDTLPLDELELAPPEEERPRADQQARARLLQRFAAIAALLALLALFFAGLAYQQRGQALAAQRQEAVLRVTAEANAGGLFAVGVLPRGRQRCCRCVSCFSTGLRSTTVRI